MKILLVSPGTARDIDGRITREIPYLFANTLFAPHAVAAVAALTPEEHQVEIHDEYSRGPADPILQKNTYDIIGISITSNQLKRSLYLAQFAKKHQPESLVVVGGIGVENLVAKNPDNIDVVFHGEAEETWPRFLEDIKTGKYLPVYKNVAKPDMTKTPAPRWELLRDDLPGYTAALVQTTRGCPFDCSFCDVIYTYGRKPRSKTIPQVLEEVKRLSTLKTKMIFIADDNFAGDKKYTKALLKELIPLNNSFRTPIEFLTQIDITIATDEELLTLLADCNFQAVMIGIESVSEASLKDLNKQQNLRVSISEAVKKIQSYGIIVLAHMIIGADSDDQEVFSRTAGFIAEANIVHHLCHPLAAPYGTKMWYDMKRKGRIIFTDMEEISDKLDIVTNIIPKQLSRVELFEGLADYWEDIYLPEKFKQRALAFIRDITYKPKIKDPGLHDLWRLRKMLFRVITFYLFDIGKEHRKAFFTIISKAARKGMYLLPKIIYIYTCYLVDYQRSLHDAKLAREYAQWERENPEKIRIDDTPIPVAEKIREEAASIFNTAWYHIRPRTSNKEHLLNTVISAMVDYNDRVGTSFETYDHFQEELVKNLCERALNQIPETGIACLGTLPSDPPAGFTREILDALDNAVRYRNMNICSDHL
ncbi:MAG: radical SAM protein [Bacteroidales bacterium]|nr:radical SAM protein [Bacteroidales bacterium]